MLLMNLTEEENLTRVVLQIDAGFASYIFAAMYLSCYVQVSSITVGTAEECMNSVQSSSKFVGINTLFKVKTLELVCRRSNVHIKTR